MRRIEATAIYATVMLALVMTAGLHSKVATQLASYLPGLRTPANRVFVVSSSGMNAPMLQARLAMANAKCAREQQMQMAFDQVKMARELAQAQKAQAKLAAARSKWEVKSAMSNSDVVMIDQVDEQDQN